MRFPAHACSSLLICNIRVYPKRVATWRFARGSASARHSRKKYLNFASIIIISSSRLCSPPNFIRNLFSRRLNLKYSQTNFTQAQIPFNREFVANFHFVLCSYIQNFISSSRTISASFFIDTLSLVFTRKMKKICIYFQVYLDIWNIFVFDVLKNPTIY